MMARKLGKRIAEAQGMAGQHRIPPHASEVRQLVATRLAEAQKESGAKVTVGWRNGQKHLDVISMPVHMLTLNPETHRIRAQRSFDPAREAQLAAAPWSGESQEYLRLLLSRKPSNPEQEDPDYLTLLDELKQSGQREPGIISPDGILVDGNTRCVALRELGVQEIQVGVLPGDTSWADINEVELGLQLRKDKRRDYTYINRLIAIDEQIRQGRLPEEVARAFNIQQRTLEGDRWVFGVILDAIKRSTAGEGLQLRLIDFEEHQEKLRELYRDFEKVAKVDPDAGELLKESRLQAILLGHAKTTVRLVEADFHQRYLDARLPAALKEVGAGPTEVAVPGLGVTVQAGSAPASAARALTDKLLKAKAVTAPGRSAPLAATEEAESTIQQAIQVFEVATHLAGKNVQLKKRQIAVPQRISDAAESLQQCHQEFAAAKAQRALDEDAFDEALLDLRAQLQKLSRQAARGIASPGDGVSWLLRITQELE
ncbi:hypothetical protein ACFYTF_21105 [Nocardia thailandica]|uniref:ParB/Sulfiredoxin domain-containing protein n=1 Tax=Nocardia thailandica TaxID=257275 RepID=A0ABW6PSE6_9NOCA